MGVLKVFLAGIGAALLALSKWWEREQRAKHIKAAQDRADRIAADPGAEWVRRFNSQANPTSKTDAGKPDGSD